MKETKLVDDKCLQIDQKITHVDQRSKIKKTEQKSQRDIEIDIEVPDLK